VTQWRLSEDDAWEIVYQTLYKVLDAAPNHKFEQEKQFAAFLFTAFKNGLKNHFRDKKKLEEHLSFIAFDERNIDEEEGLSVTEYAAQAELYKAAITQYWSDPETDHPLKKTLQEALDKLEDWERILVMQRSIGAPYAQIAEYINKPTDQLKVYHQRARKKLEVTLQRLLQKSKVD
jgi:RNA polymerase sigma factor (sigma-70 family)